MNVLRFLQEVDRRFLYALLVLAVIVPFFIPLRLPTVVSSPPRALFDTIEALPPGSFALFGVDWSAGTRGENLPQTEAIMRHLMKKKIRFAIFVFSDAQGKTLGEEVAQRLQGEYGYKEGVDWVNWGYRTSTDMQNVLKALGQDVPHTAGTDIHKQSVDTMPVMNGVHTGSDIKLLVDVTPTGSYQTYIQFLGGPYRIPTAAALTAVMVPEAFNYFDSKQLIGMVPGLAGAAEYQKLYEDKYGAPPGKSTTRQFSNSLSFAHLLIIFFIIMGNVAMLLERRQRARTGGAQ